MKSYAEIHEVAMQIVKMHDSLSKEEQAVVGHILQAVNIYKSATDGKEAAGASGQSLEELRKARMQAQIDQVLQEKQELHDYCKNLQEFKKRWEENQ